MKPVRQGQRRINPALCDYVKQEIEKLLKVGFIYPIYDIQWVSPLVIVPKKNGKWRVYRLQRIKQGYQKGLFSIAIH